MGRSAKCEFEDVLAVIETGVVGDLEIKVAGITVRMSEVTRTEITGQNGSDTCVLEEAIRDNPDSESWRLEGISCRPCKKRVFVTMVKVDEGKTRKGREIRTNFLA